MFYQTVKKTKTCFLITISRYVSRDNQDKMFLTYNSLQKYSIERLIKMHGATFGAKRMKQRGKNASWKLVTVKFSFRV